MVKKVIIVNGKEYSIIPRHRFRTSYGWAGSKGIEVFSEGHDTSQTSERFDSMKEFRKQLKSRDKVERKLKEMF